MRGKLREYRGLLWELHEHEGWRAYRWAPAALGLLVGVWVPPLAGGVAAAYIVAGGSLVAITGAVVVTLALGAIGNSCFSRRPWHRLLAGRVDAYSEQADPTDYSRALVAMVDFHAALHALKRSGLNGNGRRAIAPSDAPGLNLLLYVFRPGICVRPGQERVSEQTWRVLREAGVEARVDGRLANGDPVPIFPTLVARQESPS
jgi:hypothetical protein